MISRKQRHLRRLRAEKAKNVLWSLYIAIVDGTSFQWSLTQAQAASDPIGQAWQDVMDDFAMRNILGVSGLKTAFDEMFCNPMCDRDPCLVCCDAIRRIVPALTLAEVLRSAGGVKT